MYLVLTGGNSPLKKSRQDLPTFPFEVYDEGTTGGFNALIITRRGVLFTNSTQPAKVGGMDQRKDQREICIWPSVFVGRDRVLQADSFPHKFEPWRTYHFENMKAKTTLPK